MNKINDASVLSLSSALKPNGTLKTLDPSQIRRTFGNSSEG